MSIRGSPSPSTNAAFRANASDRTLPRLSTQTIRLISPNGVRKMKSVPKSGKPGRSRAHHELKALVQMEVDLDVYSHGNRLAIFARRIKLPLAHGFDCFFIESESQAAGNVNLVCAAIRAYEAGEHDCALRL